MTPLLKVQNIKKYFPMHGGLFSKVVSQVRAVDDVSFDLNRGEILGLVGESGCGKTTLGRMTLRLLEPTGGQVFFNDEDILKLDHKALTRLRPKMQIIFQDPYGSLNPWFNVERIIGEGMRIHKLADAKNLAEKVEEMMVKVGLLPKNKKRYPHEFSGGQRQRIGIARALALHPDYLVCDEPVSALDVSIQAQIVNLLQKLQQESGMAMLFISHDLDVVKHLSQTIAVMYLGKIVETGPTEELIREPAHPYTRALLDAKPSTNPKNRAKKAPLPGDVPSPMNPPSGCHFHPRCPEAHERCKTEEPEIQLINNNRSVRCHLFDPAGK